METDSGVTQELLSLVASLAQTLKTLIRIGLTEALNLVRKTIHATFNLTFVIDSMILYRNVIVMLPMPSHGFSTAYLNWTASAFGSVAVIGSRRNPFQNCPWSLHLPQSTTRIQHWVHRLGISVTHATNQSTPTVINMPIKNNGTPPAFYAQLATPLC
jgi:hypothetical protein